MRRPVIIDAHCDPDVPPLPPHITMKQAKGYMFSSPGILNAPHIHEESASSDLTRISRIFPSSAVSTASKYSG